MDYNITYFYWTLCELERVSFSNKIIGSSSIYMECTIFWRYLWSYTWEILRECFLSLYFQCIQRSFFKICSKIKWRSYSIDTDRESISFRTSIEKRYELCAISSGNEHTSCREWIKRSSMSHFFDTESLPEFSDHIKTRHADRLIDKVEHGLVEFRIGRATRVIEESWWICPWELPILYESSFTEEIVISEVE